MRIFRIAPIAFAAALLAAHPGAGQSWCGNPVAPPPAPENDPPQCTPQCPTCSASPCYAGSGAYVTQFSDLSMPIVGGGISISRSYSSTRLVDGIFGIGSSSILHSRVYYARYLFAAPSTYRNVADVVMPDGKHYRFTESTPGQFTPPRTRSDLLVRNGDGSFDLRVQQSRTVYRFGPAGALASIADESGNVTTFDTDASGRMSRISDSGGSGRYVDVFWGADGRIASLRDSAGRTVSYSYSASGALSSVTDPMGRRSDYSYVTGRFGTPLLSRVTDHWGRAITEITYLPTDQVSSYSEFGEMWRMFYRYGDDPKLTAKKDSGDNVWRMRFGNDIQITDRIGPDDSLSQTAYRPEGWVQEQTDEAGVRTAYAYDSAGRVTSVTRSAQSAQAVRYDYSYDAAFPDRVASVTPRDPVTNLVNADWQAWRYDYYPAGSPSPGSLFHVWRVRSDGSTVDAIATYEYDAHGRVTRQTSANGGQTDYSYDGAGNLTGVLAPANNDNGVRPQTAYGYDNSGRVLTATDPSGKTTTYTYDALGRVLTVTLPKPAAGSSLDFTTTYSYDNWDAASGLVFTNVTDPNGNVTKLGYDQHGRLVRSIDAAGLVTAYAYTKDVLSSITDANGNVTQYGYDALRRLRTTTFPDGTAESYAYRPDGLLETKTDRRGTATTYGYDPFKRLTTKAYSTGGAIEYTYQGQLLTAVVDSTATPSETHSFTYDPSYRLESASQGPRGTIAYEYGPGDRPTVVDLPGGVSSTYTYYPDGSLDTLQWSPVSGAFTWDYSVRGQYDTLTFPNGQTRAYAYDDQGRLTSLTNALGSATIASFAYAYDVDLASQPSLLGQRTRQTATLAAQGLSGALTRYGYDPLYQLTRVEYPAGAPFGSEVRTWTYDGIGNRATQGIGANVQTYTYLKAAGNPLNGQRLVGDGVDTYGYDPAGNLATRQGPAGGFTFGYDPENRLASITGPQAATYTYDYQGRRTSKTVAGVTTTYLYDGLNLLSETTNGQTSYFLNGPGIDEPLAMSRNGAISYFSVDGLGSVVATNSPTGTVTHSVIFDSWGNVKAETGPRLHPFTYTGREVGEAGFHFYRARFYQPSVGRFSQEDPIRLRGGDINFYGYVLRDPTNWIDPYGLLILPPNPGQLPPPWRVDPGHRDPNGVRYRHPSGRYVDFHRGRDGARGWRGKDHYHPDGADDHLVPGEEIPDPPAEPEPDPEPGPGPAPDGNKPPECDPTCQPKVKTLVISAGVAYVIYRCIRMVPSFAPPLWWTIPANAAIP